MNVICQECGKPFSGYQQGYVPLCPECLSKISKLPNGKFLAETQRQWDKWIASSYIPKYERAKA